jgi:MFS family permease
VSRSPDGPGATLVPQVLRVNGDFRLGFLSELTSSLGTAVSTIAFPLLVLSLGGSATQAGSLATLALATRLSLRLPAGHLVDRWSRRSAMLAADLVRFAALGSIPLVAALGRLTFLQLLAVAVVEGVATAVFGPAAGVLWRDIVTEEQLADSLGLDQAVLALANLTGPVLGGLLFTVHPMLPFAVDAATYATSALLLWMIKVRPPVPVRRDGDRGGITAGFRWLVKERSLFTILVYASGVNLISAAIPVMVVVQLRSHGESGGHIGLVLSCAGVGAVVGSLLASRLCRWLRPPAILLGIGCAWTVILGTFGVAGGPVLMASLLLVLMLMSPAAGVVVGKALLSRTPRHLLGRVTAAASTVLMGLSALGPLTAGALFQAFGADRGWLVLAAATATVVALGWSPLRAAHAAPAAPQPAAGTGYGAEPSAADLLDVVAHLELPDPTWRRSRAG